MTTTFERKMQDKGFRKAFLNKYRAFLISEIESFQASAICTLDFSEVIHLKDLLEEYIECELWTEEEV